MKTCHFLKKMACLIPQKNKTLTEVYPIRVEV